MAKPLRKQQAELSTPSPELIENLNQALTLHQNNQLKEAEKLYKKALTESRHQPDIVIMVAIFYQQIGRHKYVITLLKKLLSKHPQHAKAYQMMAASFFAEQQFENAIEALNKAQPLSPGNAEGAFLKARCFHRMGQLEQALPLYQAALVSKTDLSPFDQQQLYHQISDLLLAKGQRQDAINYLEQAEAEKLADYATYVRLSIALNERTDASLQQSIKAILLDPTRDEAKAMFGRSCEFGQVPKSINDHIKQILISCLESNKVNHQFLVNIWGANFFLEEGHERAKQLLDTEDYKSFCELLNDDKVKLLFFDPFFILGLKNIRVNQLKTERLFTNFRRYYLHKIKSNEELNEQDLSLLEAMASQCYFNEYIFNATTEESDFVAETKQELENISQFEKQHHPLIMLYACYQPLTTLENYEKLTGLNETTELTDIITTQISEPLAEKKNAKSIKSLSPINNEVTNNVRRQYEENPYPRWRTENLFSPYFTQSIAPNHLEKKQILIAGCGTGKQIFQVLNAYPNANITAIDISLASLAYAKRKLEEYELEQQVKLYQCDILESEKLNTEFDYIECCGVLHHMQDPSAGLKAITTLLKPGSKMKLAFYSKLARNNIDLARDMIQQQGFTSTADGIKQCRKYIIDNNLLNNENYSIFNWNDFYTLSECRDLLFHVQENCYDLDELKNMLADAGLTFDNFIIDQTSLELFQAQYPEENQLKDLKNWSEFEKNHPHTFSGMYQFMCFKNQP